MDGTGVDGHGHDYGRDFEQGYGNDFGNDFEHDRPRADLAIHGTILTHGVETYGTVVVRDGRIASVASDSNGPGANGRAPIDAVETIQLRNDEILIPGIVDTHGHINEPGRTAWEGFACATRAAECEANAARKIVRLVARTGCRTHILHVSSGLSVDVLRQAKAEGLPVSAETCPHYLTLDCDHIPDNATEFKCCPPIRDLREQDALWEGLADGTLDCVVTDHSPADAGMKAGTFATAWGGVSSLQVGFRTVLTGALKRGFASSDVVRWMARNTARLAGLDDRGEIAPGLRADLAIVRP